jgi:hypothetical protein
MTDSIQAQLARLYAPAVWQRLSRLPSKDQRPVASWLIKVPIGTNYAIQILQHLEDLAKKLETSPAKILTQTLTQLSNPSDLPKEFGRQFRDHLYASLHPTSAAHQERFLKWVRRLQLPKGVGLVPPKNFEGSQYKLEVHFQKSSELQEKLSEALREFEKVPWEGLKDF